MRRTALTLGFLAAASGAAARDIPLALPIDCELGQTCFIQQYVDHDPGPGARDFTCGPLTYDGHKGTDFGLPSFAAMRDGVAVLAAAPGTVVAFRDGVPDTGWDASQAGKECGNGVVIRHGDGWETQYCHLKEGSITVQKGQRVAMGAMLGQVGFSGRTEFPHLHLSVRRNGDVVDPFDSDGQLTCDAPGGPDMWPDDRVTYTPGGLLNASFLERVPEYGAVKNGGADVVVTAMPRGIPALVFWAYGYGARAGDRMILTIAAPGNPRFFEQELTLERNQAQFFRAGGRRAGAPLPPGTYTGTAILTRNGVEVDRITADVTITP